MAKVTYAELEVLAEKLTQHYREHQLFVSAYPVSYYSECYLSVEINWGDWKHEHLRCKWLTTEFFEKLGLAASFETEITEEDGSDCYSAIHRVYVC